MHAHDRTMLAKLGFLDPDRREPLHDLACGYLTLHETVSRLVQLLGLNQPPAEVHDSVDGLQRTATMSKAVVSHKVNLEWEVAKGHDQYRTTIGFADVLVSFYVEEVYSNVRVRRPDQPQKCGLFRGPQWQRAKDVAYGESLTYGIEVKILPVSVGDLIRQIKLYRSYSGVPRWIAATSYSLTPSEVSSLGNEGILHIRLGPGFDEYVESRRLAAASENQEI
jgi:hypothetical protein